MAHLNQNQRPGIGPRTSPQTADSRRTRSGVHRAPAIPAATPPIARADIRTFTTYAAANIGDLGLVNADLTPITAAQTAWTAGHATHMNAAAAAQSGRTAKAGARAVFEAALRSLVARLQISRTTTDAQRAALKITIRSKSRTTAGVPDTRPVVEIDASTPRRHILNFRDEGATRKAKPAGVLGTQVWRSVGDPAPTDPSQTQFLALDTETSYVADCAGPYVGKRAFHYLCWVNKQGQPGPWSDLFSALIGG